MRVFLLFGALICNDLASARVTPTQISPAQVKTVSQKLSGAFATRTAGDPNALGEDFEIELSAFYQDLGPTGLAGIDPTVSDQFLDSIVTLKKGLYWNLDFSISTALPIPSNLTSGFSFNIEHTKKNDFLTLKTDLYISHFNLNDILNSDTVGLTLIAYKKFKQIDLGVGANIESVSSTYNQSFLSDQLSASESNEKEFIETALISKASTRLSTFRLSAAYLFKNKDNSFYSFSVGKRF